MKHSGSQFGQLMPSNQHLFLSAQCSFELLWDWWCSLEETFVIHCHPIKPFPNAFLYCKCPKSLLEQELGNEARAFTELFSPVHVCLIECDCMSYVPILILPKVHVYTSCGLPVEELLVQLVQQKVDNIWSDFDVAICTDIVGHVHGKFPGYCIAYGSQAINSIYR